MKSNFAKKSLGQNFLQSTLIRDKIMKEAGDLKEKNVLEIGPGLGFLTTKLIASKANVTAIELDERTIEILNRDFEHKKNFTLIHGDILKQDLDTLFQQEPYQVIANIPYNITAPLIRKLIAQTKNKPTRCILMVQKEVAEKICNQKKRSILSISVELFATSKILIDVPRKNFHPIPNVDSSVIALTTRQNPLIDPELEKDFFTVVQAGFSRKRKKLSNHLGTFFGLPVEKLLGDIDGNLRAETLEIEEWVSIMKNWQKLN